jgi:hypothetical protein
VLHIATVHYDSPRWIEIQSRYLHEHIAVPFQTWTSLEGIDGSYASHFDHVFEQTGRHSDKLNHLAIEILAAGADDDLLMFLDGDAFPIADPMPLVARALARAPLLAVRRVENGGDPQPHPCFCVTTVKAWRDLGGDWSGGYMWTNAQGRRVTDVGGNLLRKLELTQTPWIPVLRSNRRDLDPVFFGIYGDVVYHHGAGFRGAQRLSRFHSERAPRPRALPPVPLLRYVLRRRDWRKRDAWDREIRSRLTAQSDDVIARIRRGDGEWLAEFR